MSQGAVIDAPDVMTARDTPDALESLPLHHQQAMALRFQGKNAAQIARIVGRDAGTVRNWFMKGGALHALYAKYVARLMSPAAPAGTTHADARTVAEQIKDAAPAALASIVELSQNARKEDVKLRAAADIMDRAGYAPVQKIAHAHAVEEMSANELNDFVLGLLGRVEQRITANADAATAPDAAAHAAAADIPAADPAHIKEAAPAAGDAAP